MTVGWPSPRCAAPGSRSAPTPPSRECGLSSSRRRLGGLLLAVGLALVAGRGPWSEAPRAEAQRPAISRSGVLGGADYLIEVPAGWSGGLVVYAHGIQRGPGPGAVGPPPISNHIIGQGHAWI